MVRILMSIALTFVFAACEGRPQVTNASPSASPAPQNSKAVPDLTGVASIVSYSTQLITSKNRVYHRGVDLMAGDWGNNLRGLMRNSNNGLFFVSDRGLSGLSNTDIDYYQKNSDNTWSPIGSQAHLAGIQQNTASIMIGNRYIYTYGVDVSSTHYLEECYFDTMDFAYHACNAVTLNGVPFQTQPGSNYVGAAVDTDGLTRVVWWTTVGASGSPGTWNYIYNFGGGWNGPVVGQLSGYNDFEYVFGNLRHQRFVGVGQLLQGDYGVGGSGSFSYQGSVVEFNLGSAPQLHLLFPDSASYAAGMRIWSGDDLYIEPSGAIHVLAAEATGPGSSPSDMLNGNIAYYFIPSGPIPSSLSTGTYVSEAYRPRFQSNGTYDSIIFPKINGSATMLDIYRKPANSGQAFNLADSNRSYGVVYDPNFGTTDTVFVESPQYQTLPAVGLDVGVMGSWSRSTDNSIWDFMFQ